MDASTWQIVSIVGYSLAGLLFISAIIMFYKLNIPAIVGDLTGRTAAKQIQEIREQNASTGQKRFQPDAFNLERGLLTEPVKSRSRGLGRISARLSGLLSGEMSGRTVGQDSAKSGGQTFGRINEKVSGRTADGKSGAASGQPVGRTAGASGQTVGRTVVPLMELGARGETIGAARAHVAESQPTEVLADQEPVLYGHEGTMVLSSAADGRFSNQFGQGDGAPVAETEVLGEMGLPVSDSEYSFTEPDILFTEVTAPSGETGLRLEKRESLIPDKSGFSTDIDTNSTDTDTKSTDTDTNFPNKLSFYKDIDAVSSKKEGFLQETGCAAEKGKDHSSEFVIHSSDVVYDSSKKALHSSASRVDSADNETLSSSTEVLVPGTEILSPNTEFLSPELEPLASETEVLSPETELLAPYVTAGTEVLSEEPGGTTILSEATVPASIETRTPIKFKVVKNVVITHTEETL
ncbi:hypothetical protein D1B31_03845 [Neobacillus notoginsengisoli]|uniref:Uncharacterized protein n=1 Tax=Neobacillus notoginsengisoli TaxID=1578198 RepID=A0A417YYY0_9BACI|nr:hypothetical protein [Neobacillus notoginsengisoli]RHW42727.1 hypothetical protein D1B31_03845 [Neobacillus notoginsengisoli]